MHALLELEDIVSVIFAMLERGDVVRCARVCKAWFPPAIKIIWEVIDFSLLVRRFFIKAGIYKKRKGSQKWVLHRKPSQAEWGRFYLYSSHVRSLHFVHHASVLGGSPWSSATKSRNQSLELQDSPEGPLFPRVRHLSYDLAPCNDLGPVSCTLGHLPQLTHLNLSFNSKIGEVDMVNFWAFLSHVCPGLIGLTLFVHEYPCDLVKFWTTLTDALQSCNRLEEISCNSQSGSIDIVLLHTISLLPNLRRIKGTFDITQCTLNGRPACQPDPRQFPHLKEVVLHWAHNISSAQGPWLRPHQLREFTCTDPLTDDMFHSTLEWLVERQALVEKLSLSSWSTVYHLREVHGLQYLQSLVLSVMVGDVAIHDADMAALAASLPNLQVIKLFSYSPTGKPLLTLLAIGHLVAHCPDLHTVMLDFDATCVPAIGESEPPRTRMHYASLLLLPPGDPPVADPAAVAAWLAHHCGRYAEVFIRRDSEKPDVSYQPWLDVERLVNCELRARREGGSG